MMPVPHPMNVAAIRFQHASALLLMVIALVACAHPPPVQAPPYPPAPPALVLDMLLADYRALGLPLPPPAAPLVRFGPMGWSLYADSPGHLMYYLGFELPKTTGEPPTVLVGTERITIESHIKVVRVQPTAEVAAGIYGAWGGSSYDTPFAINAALATAVQAKARGWDALAERLFVLASKPAIFGTRDPCYQPWAGMPPRQAFGMLARAHFANELTQPGSDWASIAPRFEASLAFAPRCNLDRFLPALHRTVEHRRSPPGTIEAKIDALCDITSATGGSDHTHAPAFLRVAELGFDAVPALLDHLEDGRLTRSVEISFKGIMHQWTLNEIVSEVLQSIAGDGSCNCAVERAARAWWAKAQAMGEEAYVVAHVLPSALDARAPHDVVLLILARKYPRQLEDAYRRALGRPRMSTGGIASAIARSALPAADRRRLLLEGARSATLADRFDALGALQPLDPEAYATLLARELDALPIVPRGPYWLAPECRASPLASLTNDPTVWAALLRAARRADLGLRMELINRLSYPGDRQLRERLTFLAAFLDDDAVPDITKDAEKWGGPRAAFTFRPIAVRDLAAMTIARLLDLPTKPQPSWTRTEWDALGVEVKRALAPTTPPAAARPDP